MAFKVRLAGHLGWSIKQVERDIDLDELRIWMAYHRYVCPIGDAARWHARVAAAALAPWSKKEPDVERILGIDKLPMTGDEIAAELAKLRRR